MISLKFMTRMWIKKLVNDILKQKLLFLALILLCFLGTSSYLALTLGYTNLEVSYKNIYDQTNFADFEYFTYDDICFNKTEIEPIINEFIINHPEIQSINYRLILDTSFNLMKIEENKSRQFFRRGRAIGIDWQIPKMNRINDLIVDRGSYFNSSSPDNSILLESHFAKSFDLKEGNSLKTGIFNQTYSFSIQGIVFSPEYLVIIPSKYDFLPSNSFGIIYLPMERLQKYTNLTSQANNLVVKMISNTPKKTSNSVIKELTNLLNLYTNDSFIEPIPQEFQFSNLALSLDINTFKEISLLLPLIILIVASISIYIALGRMIQNQKRNIGIAVSIGYQPNDILFHYICFSLLIGGLGTLSGLIIGIPTSSIITLIYSYFMNFPQIVKIQIHINIILISTLTGIGTCILGGAVPAWNASRMIPREILQINPSIEKGSHSIIEKISLIKKGGLGLIIPIRNLFRFKKRSFATITALLAAVIILVISFTFIDSVANGVNHQFNHTSQYDIIVKYDKLEFFDLGVRKDISYIQSLNGILSVDSVFQMPSVIYFGEKSEDVLINAWSKPNPAVHNFSWSSQNDSLSDNGSIVVCSAIAKKYGLQTGNIVEFSYPKIPGITLAFNEAFKVFENHSLYTTYDYARNKTLEFLSRLIEKGRESFSFSEGLEKISMNTGPIKISGISKEIWGNVIYTTTDTINEKIRLNIFKNYLNIDLTPSSQLIMKVSQPDNLTLLEEIQQSISQLDGIRSIEFRFDLLNSVDMIMGIFNAVTSVFLLIACILASSSIFTSIYMNFQEKQREIATMLTLGLSYREFIMMLSIENLIQAVLGIILGIPIGLWFSSILLHNFLRYFYFEIFLHTISLLILSIGIVIVVLLSQIPAIYKGIKLDLTIITKELSSH